VARDTICQEDESQSSSSLSLAERLKDGSASAWGDLVRLYGPLVDRWCGNANVPPDAIPDVAQEVFLAAFRGVDRFDPNLPKATFRGWLWTVARSRIVEYYRKRNGEEIALGGSTGLAQLRAVADPVPLQEPTEPDEASALLRRALEQIRAEFTAGTWDLFWRAAILGHPTDLVANENGISSAAVRQAKSRVLRRLRKQLGDR
jgi:RNA polymerase sigma-70 factor (ECF subfamily)